MDESKKSDSKLKIISEIIWIVILLIGINIYFFNSVYNSSDESSKINNKNYLSFYIGALPYGVEPSYANSIREAASYWEQRDKVIFKEVSSRDDDNLVIQWIKEFGGEHIGQAFGSQLVEVGVGDSLCLGRWRAYDYGSVLNIAKHELGHVIGYNHSDNPSDIMYYQIITKYDRDFEESELLPPGYFKAYPVCTRDNSSEYQIKLASNEQLDVYIVPSEDDYQRLAEDKSFKQFKSCSFKKTRDYEETCIVSKDSLIVLHNPYDNDASFTLTAKEL